ncbi:Cadmium resistance transporter [Roseovarius albus]|uniref:Cadmium resistance transporter n=1 Tax=Roseovarius albus TaxID=1247867 RepID=A0A1X6YZ30_9RHOB|nr:hypothetical protein [Roseovarius albus]SLN35585.1 Cadmium resistance transporter [Roseovarius albus]
MDLITFAFSAAIAQLLTSLDNLAVLLAFILSVGRSQAVSGYILSQVLMLGAALLAALGLAQLMSGQIGYLGLVPIVLGVWTLLFRAKDEGEIKTPKYTGTAGIAVIFLCMSFDSFAVMMPLLADSLPSYRTAVIVGAIIAVGTIVGLAALVAKPMRHWAPRLEKLGAIAMILAGVYVLVNTGTDIS